MQRIMVPLQRLKEQIDAFEIRLTALEDRSCQQQGAPHRDTSGPGVCLTCDPDERFYDSDDAERDDVVDFRTDDPYEHESDEDGDADARGDDNASD